MENGVLPNGISGSALYWRILLNPSLRCLPGRLDDEISRTKIVPCWTLQHLSNKSLTEEAISLEIGSAENKNVTVVGELRVELDRVAPGALNPLNLVII